MHIPVLSSTRAATLKSREVFIIKASTDKSIPNTTATNFLVLTEFNQILQLLPPFQIIRCFGFSRYIAFIMNLDTKYIARAIYLGAMHNLIP